MARRGDLAREALAQTIKKAFGDNYVATVDKKVYVNVPDGLGGELIQFAISWTMPKTTIGTDAGSSSDETAEVPMATELSPEDKAKVEELKKRLGIE